MQNSTGTLQTRMSLAVAVIIIAAAAPQAFTQATTMMLTSNGTVTYGPNTPLMGNAVGGVQVQVGLKGFNGKYTWGKLVSSVGNGSYSASVGTPGAPIILGLNGNVPSTYTYDVVGKRVVGQIAYLGQSVGGPFNSYVFNNYQLSSYYFNSGAIVNPFPPAGFVNGGNNVVTTNVTLAGAAAPAAPGPRTTRVAFLANAAGGNFVSLKGGALAAWDPTYSFTPGNAPNTGTISFTGDVDPTDPNIPIDGAEVYANGDEVETDNVDVNGNPVDENLNGADLQISNLSVTGLDANGNPTFGTANISVTDSNGNPLFSAVLSNIIADAGGDYWTGMVTNPQFPDEADSTTETEWANGLTVGDPFEVSFDPSFITQTDDFTQAASSSTEIELATLVVPEPGTISVMFLSAGLLLRRQRRFA